MKTSLLLLVPALVMTARAAEPSVTVAGIQAIYDEGEKEFGGFKTYNSEKGLGVTLMVRAGDKPIVAFDDDKAALKIGGVDAKCKFFGGGDMSFSKDRKALRLEFSIQGKPQVAADGTIKIVGELPVSLAAGKDEARSEVFKVAAGSEIKFPAGKTGMPVLKVKSSGKPKWDDNPMEIEFSTDTKPDSFAGIKFYTKDGKPVESDRNGSSWMSFGGKGSGEVTYSFKAPQTELILAIETWSGREDKKLKVDLSAGFAMP